MFGQRNLYVYMFLGAVLLLESSFGYIGQECTTPRNVKGACTFLNECQPVNEIYQKRPLTQENIDFIRQSACSRDRNTGKAVVCCPPDLDTRGNLASLLPDWTKCGQDTQNKIANGEVTTIGEFPWLALLEYTKADGQKSFQCGGSLINSRYVLTAAHCINTGTTWILTGVKLGEHDTTVDPDCIDRICAPSPKNYGIESTKVHEQYQVIRTATEDIALVRLNRDVAYDAYIHPICLPFINPLMRSKDYTTTEMTVAGWGRTENGRQSNMKLKVNLQIRDRNTCNNHYQPLGVNLNDKQICAGGIAGRDSCKGDSGGSLAVLEENREKRKSWYLWGIVSFGPRACGQSNVPGVYVKVDKYEDWILNNIQP